MDVNLIHKLTIGNSTTVIGEPQGFDDLEVSIERTDYHGISAEQSVGNLGFYGIAADIIEDAYNTNIDTVVVYSAETQEGNVIYSGVVDLSTYQQKVGDYRLVTCKVGEIGVKTTFNNRSEVEADLLTDETIEGYSLTHIPTWHKIQVPQKHLLYTDASVQRYDVEYTAYEGESTQSLTISSAKQFISYPLTSSDVVEFGTLTQNTLLARANRSFPYQYSPNSDHETLFGVGTRMDIEAKLIFELRVNSFSIDDARRSVMFDLYLGAYAGEGIIWNGRKTVTQEQMTAAISSGEPILVEIVSKAHNVPARQDIRFYIDTSAGGVAGSYSIDCTLTIKRGSCFKLFMFDNLPEETTLVEMIHIHDALNTITEVISDNQLTVKSDWYGHIGSIVNPTTTIGGGALKAITNGYKMRGIVPEDDDGRNMPLSFKDMIKSLQALDCIGWGFSNENGTEYVRVEPRQWFYKNDVLFSISGAKEVIRKIDPDKIITKLTIGYKKYNTNEDYNSIDNVHSERTFVSGIKAVSKEVESLCEFIADNYAIEETRRARTTVNEHEEFKYDENIFIFELVENRVGAESDKDGALSIICTALNDYEHDIVGINRPEEFINAKLSPRRMAERWRSQGALFMTNANASGMDFSSGTVNYKASYTDRPTHSENIYSLDAQSCVAEDENIADNRSPQMAETIEFEYPITRAQFAAIKANPYGIIVVNGDHCWIKKVQYSVITGKTKFTLIPKHTEEE